MKYILRIKGRMEEAMKACNERGINVYSADEQTSNNIDFVWTNIVTDGMSDEDEVSILNDWFAETSCINPPFAAGTLLFWSEEK